MELEGLAANVSGNNIARRWSWWTFLALWMKVRHLNIDRAIKGQMTFAQAGQIMHICIQSRKNSRTRGLLLETVFLCLLCSHTAEPRTSVRALRSLVKKTRKKKELTSLRRQKHRIWSILTNQGPRTWGGFCYSGWKKMKWLVYHASFSSLLLRICCKERSWGHDSTPIDPAIKRFYQSKLNCQFIQRTWMCRGHLKK